MCVRARGGGVEVAFTDKGEATLRKMCCAEGSLYCQGAAGAGLDTNKRTSRHTKTRSVGNADGARQNKQRTPRQTF